LYTKYFDFKSKYLPRYKVKYSVYVAILAFIFSMIIVESANISFYQNE